MGNVIGCGAAWGVIPWDDDIDIAMLRKDYNRFMEISNDEQRLKRFYGCPYILGLDIFPLDYVSKNEEETS